MTKWRVFATWLIDEDDFNDVHDGNEARACAQTQINGGTDFPDAVQMTVVEDDRQVEPVSDVFVVNRLAAITGRWYAP